MKSWHDVSLAEFEAFLQNYPRPLETRPPLSQRKLNFRAWFDGLGSEYVNAQTALRRCDLIARNKRSRSSGDAYDYDS